MKTPATHSVKAFTLIALGLVIGAAGVYVGEVDDAPGAGGIGLILMVAGIVLGVRAARNNLPAWAARTAIAVGVVIAAFATLFAQGIRVAAPLFAQPQVVPSAVAPAPPPQYAAAVERARGVVRAAILEQNLPGISVAVGVRTLIWAEGFGWRDVDTETPVTPDTRFNIGTAAAAVGASMPALKLTNTGTDPASAWSPEHIGEPGEDFPPLTMIRKTILTPIGLVPSDYPLPGNRATFYAPRSDDNPRRGRRLMYMRDLACCANGMAFYSTPSDLVRYALATNAADINGELAGGTVMSLVTRPDSGIAIAVASNIAHANTAALARRVAEAFAEQTR